MTTISMQVARLFATALLYQTVPFSLEQDVFMWLRHPFRVFGGKRGSKDSFDGNEYQFTR